MSLSPDALAQLGEFNLEEARGDLGFIRAPGPGELAAADLSADEISGLRSWDFSGALAGLDSLTFEAAHPHEETNNEVRKKKFFRQAAEGLANFLQNPFGIKSRLAARSAARGAAVSPAEEKGGIRNWFRRKDRISIEASQSWWKRLGATAVAVVDHHLEAEFGNVVGRIAAEAEGGRIEGQPGRQAGAVGLGSAPGQGIAEVGIGEAVGGNVESPTAVAREALVGNRMFERRRVVGVAEGDAQGGADGGVAGVGGGVPSCRYTDRRKPVYQPPLQSLCNTIGSRNDGYDVCRGSPGER